MLVFVTLVSQKCKKFNKITLLFPQGLLISLYKSIKVGVKGVQNPCGWVIFYILVRTYPKPNPEDTRDIPYLDLGSPGSLTKSSYELGLMHKSFFNSL